MSVKTIHYDDSDIMKIEKKLETSNGFRALHTDFTNNDESQGYEVTFVDGLDDPSNDPVLVAQRQAEEQRQIRVTDLKTKLRNRTISQIELLELLEKAL